MIARESFRNSILLVPLTRLEDSICLTGTFIDWYFIYQSVLHCCDWETWGLCLELCNGRALTLQPREKACCHPLSCLICSFQHYEKLCPGLVRLHWVLTPKESFLSLYCYFANPVSVTVASRLVLAHISLLPVEHWCIYPWPGRP